MIIGIAKRVSFSIENNWDPKITEYPIIDNPKIRGISGETAKPIVAPHMENPDKTRENIIRGFKILYPARSND